MMTLNNHYFLLSNNSWPLLLSFSLMNLVISAILMIKFLDFIPLLISTFILSLLSFSWWISYSNEFSEQGKESFSLEKGIKMSMLLFISSEVLFFFSFFWAYFHFSLSPPLELSFTWPPYSVEMFDHLGVPLINTLTLLSSGMFVTLSHMFMMKEHKNMYLLTLLATVLMGLVFSFLQYEEYLNSFFTISDSAFGTSFFVLTGFHGVHVLIGTTYLFTVLIRSLKIVSDKNCISFELSAWYWHFVDVIWIFLYFFLYYLSS